MNVVVASAAERIAGLATACPAARVSLIAENPTLPTYFHLLALSVGQPTHCRWFVGNVVGGIVVRGIAARGSDYEYTGADRTVIASVVGQPAGCH